MIDLKNKFIVYAGVGLVVFFIVVGIIIQMTNQEKKIKPVLSKETSPAPTLIAPENKTALTPANPADYGMIVYSEVSKPKTQEDWDQLVEESFAQTKKSLPEETQQAMAALKLDKDAYAKRMQEIQERIKVFEKRLKDNPSDEEAQMRLDKLKILQAVSKTLKQDIVKE